MTLKHVYTTPILRSFDEAKAREFYVGFLGFTVDWEHRFEPDLPLFMQVSRGGIILWISEHFGDALPGGSINIQVTGLRDFHAELIGKRYKHARPGLEPGIDEGAIQVSVKDPAGNTLCFVEKAAS